jgi:hypothetical protein
MKSNSVSISCIALNLMYVKRLISSVIAYAIYYEVGLLYVHEKISQIYMQLKELS